MQEVDHKIRQREDSAPGKKLGESASGAYRMALTHTGSCR